MPSAFLNRIPYFVALASVWIGGFFKIADLDFWWHLKTGQIILSERRFQFHEIYSFTAQGREYVDHEWLFQVLQWLAYAAGSELGVILLKCIVLSSIYILLAHYLLRNEVAPAVASLILALSVCGARTRFIERPEVYSILFLIVIYIVLDHCVKKGEWKWSWILPPIFILWANIHAAVVLGSVLLLIFIAGLALELVLKQEYPVFYFPDRKKILMLVLLLIVSTACTGINPTGYRVLTVPFELTSLIDSGLLQNQEWQQPPFSRLPFFYACLVFVFLITVINFRKVRFVPFILAAFLSYISLKYVRNVGLFSMMMPLMVAPYVSGVWITRSSLIAVPITILLMIAIPQISTFEPGVGIASYFPRQIVEFTKTQNLQGHLLNSYAFGGYLIWTLYPERRIFIDGRNEVYLPLLKEIVRVRADGRQWKKFLEKYHIEYALLNYVDDLEEVTIMDPDRGPVKTYAPFSSTHFPRKDWALVYWDDAGMIFTKRNGTNRQVERFEYRSIFPEGRYYQESLVRAGEVDKAAALSELKRKLTEDRSCKRALSMYRTLSSNKM